MDLVVRGGTVVTVGGRSVADIGIQDGKVVQLGGALEGSEELDATDLFVTPGGVDPHVHLTPPTRDPGGWRWVDDFESGTRAALAGGVTTVGNISFPGPGETLADVIEHDDAEAGRMSLADYFLHPVLMEPDEANLATIAPLHAAGHTSVKIFLSFRRFDRHVPEYLAAMRKVHDAGGIALVHCEDAAIIDCCCNLLREAGNTDARFYPDSRPLQAEVVATTRAVGFAETTGCPTYVVHLASSRALQACHDGRSRGIPVYVETRPLYLHLTRERFEEPDGAKYTGAPPLRESVDVDAMWAGLKFGHIDTLATDHAPWMLADKLDPNQSLAELRQGVADLETCLPMLFSRGVLGGRVTLEQFVAVTSTNPAKLFGLYPRKGAIEVGADADLVLWDPAATAKISARTHHHHCDRSIYQGFKVTGTPATVIAAGEIRYHDGNLRVERGAGRYLRRNPVSD